MESVSRPPQRRKHSPAATAFPVAGKNPYDDVFLSRGGKGRALEAHEYTEIFSGSPTSIPVLDLSALEVQAESGDGQVSALDYANIFGGLRNDDVAAPYEEVFGGSAKKNKHRIPGDSKPSLRQSSSLQTRKSSEIPTDSQPSLRQSSYLQTRKSSEITADSQPSLQQSGSLHKRKSSETSYHSIPGVEQQFNVSFNKTHQRDSDVSNGKTHIAQLSSVPGFTFFVNETPRQLDTEGPKPVPPLKRDVSRNWSFSGEDKDVKGKHGVSLDKFHVTDMSLNRNKANVKSHPSKVSPSSNHPLNPSNSKDPIHVRAFKFASNEDTSKKDDGEYSPPFLDEEFDGNSVAAESAAALKKAIEEAQESIRQAKLIMERKKAGHEDRSKSRLDGRLKDSSEKTKIEHEVSGFKEALSREEHEKLQAKFTGVNGKGGRFLSQTNIHPNDGNTGVETAQKKVEGAKDHGEQFMPEDGLFNLSSSQLEKNFQSDRNEENIISAPKIHGEATQCGTASLGSQTVGNDDGLMPPSMRKVAPDNMRIETGKEALEQRDVSVSHAGHQVLSERDLNRSPRMRDKEESVVEPELYHVNFDRAKRPEVIVEPLGSVSKIPQLTLELEKVLDEDDENWRMGLEEKVFEESESDAYGIGKSGKKFEGREEVHNVANLAEPELAVITFLKESWNLMGNKVPEQDDIKWHPGDASDCKENEHNDSGKYDEGENEMNWKEEFECKMHQEEVLEEEIAVRKLTIHPVMGEFEKKFETWELEIDKKQNYHDADEPKSPKIEERHQENQLMETSNLARAQKNESLRDVEESQETSTLRETERSEEDHNEKRHENSSGYEADESQVPEPLNFGEPQKNDVVWDVEETNITLRGLGRSEEDHNEEIHEDTYGHGADHIGIEPISFVVLQKNEPVRDVGEANDTMRSAGRNEERHGKTSENQANENLATKAGNFAAIPVNNSVWYVGETNSPLKAMGTSEGHHNEEKHEVPSEHEADKIQVMEANKFAEVWKNETFWDVEETNSTLKETGRSEEHHDAFEFQEAAYDVCTDEAIGANNDGVGLKNAAEQYQKPVERSMENDTVSTSMGSQVYKSTEAEKSFPLEDNEIPGIESLRRIASEQSFVRSQHNNATEGLLSGNKTENVGVADSDSKDNSSEVEHVFETDTESHGTAQYYAESNLSGVNSSDNRSEEFDLTDERPVLEQTSESDKGSVSTCSPEDMDRLSSHGSEGCAETMKDATPSKEEIVNEPEASTERKCTEQSDGLFSQPQSKPKETKEFIEAKRTEGASFNIENSEDPVGTINSVEKDTKESVQDFEKQERQQRIEAFKRGREREKERQVVERAIREARERAFAEARERAGKAAAEKAAAEVQQKVMTEAQQKLEKPPAVKQPDNASTEAKLRAERAVVEKVLAEARGRALEKALSQKTSAETRTASDRNKGLKHSFSSSDLENSTAPESEQRRKARLERHQRIMERSAKALAEKNMRDFLAQKEQAERNRLAESLDADIKRWATGKEGNLCALLSTLHYILGRDSGWLPIPLTEMLTPAAVKKAYRKATLYVHPDKLQQRGASIRQKYICEKVFDLLKAAWNKFNSEER